MRKTVFYLTGAVLAAVLMVSCSVVFDAGVSGQVYYYSGSTKIGISGAKVYVYSDPEGTDLLASTTTDSSGNYTVNRVVWETTRSRFGKTADLHTVYIKAEHDDFASSGLVGTRVVSDSTNPGLGDIRLQRRMFSMPVFSGHVSEDTSWVADSVEVIENKYDNKSVFLCYEEEGEYVVYSSSSATVTSEITTKRNRQITETSSSGITTVSYQYMYNHGSFTGLGGNSIKYEAVPDESTGYAEFTVYIIVDVDDDGVPSSGDMCAEVTIQSDEGTVEVPYKSFQALT